MLLIDEKTSDILKERSEIRYNQLFESSKIDDPSLYEKIENASLNEIVEYFKSEDPDIILLCLKKVRLLMEQENDIKFFLDYSFQLIYYLNNFAEIDNKTEENETNSEKYAIISDLSMNILDQLFSMEINVQENSTAKEPFFNFYIDSDQISDTEQMGTCFSVINKMIDYNITYNKLFFNSRCFDFIIQVPKLQLPPIYLAQLMSIISTCIKQEGLNDIDIEKPLEGVTKLFSQLMVVLENFKNYDSSILDTCAKGCYHYVSIDSTATFAFIVSDSHIKLINSMSNMSDIGASYSISALGKCFFSSIPNAVLPPEILNIINSSESEEGGIFDVEAKVVNDIPIDIFKDGLELKDKLARADAVNALCNVMVKVNSLIDQIFQSGLFDSLMNHFLSDNFNVRVSILNVFFSIFQNVTQNHLSLFVNKQFFHAVEDLVESDSPDIEQTANLICTLVESDKEHEDIIKEFSQFLYDRSL